MSSVRVLGVDPGLTRCGVGIVDGRIGSTLSMVSAGVIRTPADQELSRRLLAVESELESLIEKHRPSVLAIERVFSQHNLKSVMGTAQVSGVAMVVAARHGLSVYTHTPTEVKASITGSGRADKAQVTHMVTRLLRLDQAPKPADAADALAIAICHIWRGTATNRLASAMEGRA